MDPLFGKFHCLIGRHRMTMVTEPEGPVLVQAHHITEGEMNPRVEWQLV